MVTKPAAAQLPKNLREEQRNKTFPQPTEWQASKGGGCQQESQPKGVSPQGRGRVHENMVGEEEPWGRGAGTVLTPPPTPDEPPGGGATASEEQAVTFGNTYPISLVISAAVSSGGKGRGIDFVAGESLAARKWNLGRFAAGHIGEHHRRLRGTRRRLWKERGRRSPCCR